MTSYHHRPQLRLTTTALVLVALSRLSPDIVLSQSTLADCGPSFLPLATCAPFVQGMADGPAQVCCRSLAQLYTVKHSCFCLLLHDSTVSSSFPINTTLALQLPSLCSLQIDISTCNAGSSLPSPSPPTQVSYGANPNSGVVSTFPIGTAAPRPNFMGYGLRQSAEVRLKVPEHHLLMLMLLAAISILPDSIC